MSKLLENYLDNIQTEGAISNAIFSRLIARASRKAIEKSKKDKLSKCSKLSGQEKTNCYINVEAMAAAVQVRMLKNSKSKCSQSKNPATCVKLFDSAIEHAVKKANKNKHLKKAKVALKANKG